MKADKYYHPDEVFGDRIFHLKVGWRDEEGFRQEVKILDVHESEFRYFRDQIMETDDMYITLPNGAGFAYRHELTLDMRLAAPHS